MISFIYRAAAPFMLAAVALPAAAAAQSNAMPDALIGVWSDNDADGRAQCALWRGDPVARDDGYDPLVGAVVITKGLIHGYAEYGEGNFYKIERVDAAGSGRWHVRSLLYLDTLPPEGPPPAGASAPLPTIETLTLTQGVLVWTAPEEDARTLFRCGDLPK